jgi:TPR repeat protein
VAFLEKAAGQGHAYATDVLGSIHSERNEHEQAVEWFTMGAEAGLPQSMFNLACFLDQGKGEVAPDYPAAADWYRRAADAGDGEAAGAYTRPLLSST